MRFCAGGGEFDDVFDAGAFGELDELRPHLHLISREGGQ